MLWFEEEHIPFMLCAACGCAVLTHETCDGCGLVFHQTCIAGRCVSCTASKKTSCVEYKGADALEILRVLDLKRAVKSPAALYRYALIRCARKNTSDSAQTASSVRCHCCGSDSAPFFYGKPFCRGCIAKIDRNEYCPVCMKAYDPDDYDTEMMCCDYCLRWVHLECDSSFKAQYHEEPDAAEYRCPPCAENARRWAALREDLARGAETCGIPLGPSQISRAKKAVCTYCGEGSARDTIGLLRPLAGTIPTQLAHPCCGDYRTKKCAKCRATGSTVKCWGCSSCFHLKCAEGLFRQDRDTPFCNVHFYVHALHPEHDAQRKGGGEEVTRGKRRRGISMLNKDVVYRPLLFTKIIFSGGAASLLVFDGKGFYIDGRQTDARSIKESLLLDVQHSDVFRVRSHEYQKYRRMLAKSKGHERVLRALLQVVPGVHKKEGSLHKMASRGSGKAGINWMSKRKAHSTFQRLELSDVIDKVIKISKYFPSFPMAMQKRKQESEKRKRHRADTGAEHAAVPAEKEAQAVQEGSMNSVGGDTQPAADIRDTGLDAATQPDAETREARRPGFYLVLNITDMQLRRTELTGFIPWEREEGAEEDGSELLSRVLENLFSTIFLFRREEGQRRSVFVPQERDRSMHLDIRDLVVGVFSVLNGGSKALKKTVKRRDLEKIPVVRYCSEERNACSICLSAFVRGDELRLLRCRHMFHRECVDPWFLQSSDTCPMCRVPVLL
ncbi:UNVERIFIED_CONTAM: hypothetical protein PYX00_011631 [Menopon gallinae]|uniref:RING-type domain-containing protein n=1 Tax=Menopon gallinae TaxID=328185 RepID=A0AAW2H7V7_9NEOP